MKLEEKDILRFLVLKGLVDTLLKAASMAARNKLLEGIEPGDIPQDVPSALRLGRMFVEDGRVIKYLEEERTPQRAVLLAYLIRREGDNQHPRLTLTQVALEKQEPSEVVVDVEKLRERISEKTWRAVSHRISRRELSPTLFGQAVENGTVPSSVAADCIVPSVTLRLMPIPIKKQATQGEVRKARRRARNAQKKPAPA